MFCKKGMAIFLTAVCFCMSFSVSTIAETTDSFIIDEVSPAYEIAYNSTSSLTINDKMAYCISKAKGNNVVSITVEQTLEKYSGWFAIWNVVDGAYWSKTFTQSTISFSNTKSGLASGTYRLKSVFTLTNSSGKTETITIYSQEKSVP
jgi:hypothetical protein